MDPALPPFSTTTWIDDVSKSDVICVSSQSVEPGKFQYLSFIQEEPPTVLPQMYQTRQEVIQKLLNGGSNCSAIESSEESNSSGGRCSLARQRHWPDPEKFVEDNLQEVYEKLPNLEKQIWGKLIAMEGNRRTAKAYLRHPVITIDGSDAEFDGLKIGLSRFENIDRMDIVYEIFNEILQGIKVKIDPDGNIWAKRMCDSPVFLKPLYRNRPNDLFVIAQRPVKVFDIRRFKEILVQELRQEQPNRRRLEKCCLVCLKFSVDHYDLLRTPCWIVVVHLVAIELLNLVMPKDNDLSSPSSSFVGGGGSPQPGPSTSNNNPGEQYSTNTPPRPWGRANRGGVFKRIVRKEEQPHHHLPPQMQMGPPPGMGMPPHGGPDRGQFFYGSSAGLVPSGSGYRSDYDARYRVDSPLQSNRSHPGSSNSMLDLRQLAQLQSPIYYGNGEGYSPHRRGGGNEGRGITAQGIMGDRVFSMDALNTPTNRQPPMQVGRPCYMPEPHVMAAQMEREMQYRKWKSQDSGLGSGGSYGSK